MSDIALFSKNVPDYLKEVELDDLTKSLSGNTGLKRISIRGGVFRLVANGEEIAKNENRAMNVCDCQRRSQSFSPVLRW
jgi:hypothetical protein